LHDVRTVEVATAGVHAAVHVVVSWHAVTRDGRTRSLVADQHWTVVRSARTGLPVIRRYRVEPLVAPVR
jgi:hypothetical protein